MTPGNRSNTQRNYPLSPYSLDSPRPVSVSRPVEPNAARARKTVFGLRERSSRFVLSYTPKGGSFCCRTPKQLPLHGDYCCRPSSFSPNTWPEKQKSCTSFSL